MPKSSFRLELWLTRQLRDKLRLLSGSGISFLVSAAITYSSDPWLTRGVWIWLLAVGLILVIIPPVLLRGLDYRSLNREVSRSLWVEMASSVPPYLRDLVERRRPYVYDSVLELRSHPRLKMGDAGWQLSELEFKTRARPFQLPSDLVHTYRAFLAENLELPEKLRDDRKRVSLTRVPAGVYTDSPTPVLEWVWTRYSEMRFYQTRFGERLERPVDSLVKFQLGREEREKALHRFAEEALSGGADVSFPSSLSIHCLVVTGDDQLIVVRRSADVAYHRNLWVPTHDENISQEDFGSSDANFVAKCIERGLREELVGPRVPTRDLVDLDKVRVLSFFMEASLPAIGLLAYVPLEMSWEKVKLHLQERMDNEGVEWKGVPARGLNWNTLKELGDWAVPTHFLLMMMKLHRNEDPQEVLPS